MLVHRRLLWVACGVLVVAVAAWLAWPRHRPPAPPAAFVVWPVADLPRHLYRTGKTDIPARVTFQLPLTPTADPLVWEYRPAWPPERMPPTYRVLFPSPVTAPPATVEGVAERIDPDLKRRPNGVPGVLVFRASPTTP